MANSRELVECVASALGRPLTAVTGHMRNLREADSGLVSHGGRGITSPAMTMEDAASLVCAVYGSESIQGSSDAVLSLKELAAKAQGFKIPRVDPHDRPRATGPLFTLGLPAEHSVIQGLAAALRLFAREHHVRKEILMRTGQRDLEIYARFSVQYPEHFASLTVGIHGYFSEGWTYGTRGRPRTRQSRECDHDALREIAKCVAS
jgi:hypothetical protein